MKFTVQKSAFLEKLTPAMGTVSSKNTISSIEGVLIETVEGKIRISTYDMNKGVRAYIEPISIEREGKYIINAQRLYQTVRVMPDDEMCVEVEENYNCHLTCGTSSFSIFAMRGTDFPNLPELTTERGFSLCGAQLKKMIGRVIHSVAQDASRPMLCGTFVKVEKGKMELVSCDSYTLSICTESCEYENIGEKDSYSFIIPGHALGELCKILPDESDRKITVYLSRKHAIFRAEDIIFFTRTVDSEYIDYRRIIPKENTVFVDIDRERLLAGLERANIIAEEKIQGSGKSYVKINVSAQKFILHSVSVNGKVYDETDCVHEGDDIEIGFNCRYLINSMRVAQGESIHIEMKSPTQAMTITPSQKEKDSDYLYMVLPVRMNTAG